MNGKAFVFVLMFVLAIGGLSVSAGACDRACCADCGPSMVCAPSDAPAGLLPVTVPDAAAVMPVGEAESPVRLSARPSFAGTVLAFLAPTKLFLKLQTLLI